MEFTVEKFFEHSGLPCVALRVNGRHRCGYVGVEKGHPLFGVDYTARIPYTLPEDEKIGSRGVIPLFLASFDSGAGGTRADCFFDVHGGLTYSRLTEPGQNYPIAVR